MMMKLFAGAAVLLILPAVATAQDDERVKRIVERVEKEIRESHERTREEIRAIIRAEIQKSGGNPAAPAAPARKVYLGITAGDITDEERKAHATGIKIADVRGPAKEAGIAAGDFVTEIDGREVSEDNIGEILSKRQPGDSVELTVVRGKKSRHVKVVLVERKD
jgi:S1-C subfamily serine protease